MCNKSFFSIRNRWQKAIKNLIDQSGVLRHVYLHVLHNNSRLLLSFVWQETFSRVSEGRYSERHDVSIHLDSQGFIHLSWSCCSCSRWYGKTYEYIRQILLRKCLFMHKHKYLNNMKKDANKKIERSRKCL